MSVDTDEVVQKLIEAYGEAREEAGRNWSKLQDSSSRERVMQADLSAALRDRNRLQAEANQRELAMKRYEALHSAAAAIHAIFDEVIPPGSVVRQIAEVKFSALQTALKASEADVDEIPF